MNEPWTADELRAFLRSCGIPAQCIKLRFESYCLPRYESLPGLRAAFAAELSGKQRKVYRSVKNNCVAFALLADEAVREQWHLTPDTPDAAISFGLSDCFLNIEGHSRNAGVFVKDSRPVLLYFEPQYELLEVTDGQVTWIEI